MGAVFGLVDLALGGAGGQTRGGAAALNIHNDAGHFGHGGVTDIFLFQGEARARGGGQCFGAGEAGADNGGHPCDLVFHLNEFPAVFGQFLRHDLSDLRGGGDGVTRVKAHAGMEGAEGAGFITLH